MSSIAFLIEQTAIALYIFIAIGLFLNIRKWLMAGYAYRSTTFELERDFARQQRSGAFFMTVLLIEVGLVVAGVQTVVAPTVREDRAVVDAIAIGSVVEEERSTDGVFATATSPAVLSQPEFDTSGIELGVDDDAVIFVTPTLTPTPVGTIQSNPPDVIGCDTAYASLQIPANGMRVFQPIRVAGTAWWEEFSQFKLEISGPETLGQYWVLDNVPFAAEGQFETLSQFDPDAYEPGTYRFRLAVFDTTDTLVASCEVTIFISRPEPTPTPLGG